MTPQTRFQIALLDYGLAVLAYCGDEERAVKRLRVARDALRESTELRRKRREAATAPDERPTTPAPPPTLPELLERGGPDRFF